jgi:hypothetical protein
LEVYFVEHVKKVKDFAACDDFLSEKSVFAIKHGDKKRAQTLLERIVGYAKHKLPALSDTLATSLMEDGLYSKAY